MGVEKRKRFLINTAYIAVIALLVFVVLHYLLPMVAPFAIAAVVTWCSMFLGLQLFGVFGLFGFPILLSLLCYLNDHGVIQIFR